MPRPHPLLLASLRSFPREDGPRERLAQWYTSSGDHRGEALRLLLEMARLPKPSTAMSRKDRAEHRELSSRFDELREKHEDLWLDEWGLERDEVTWDTGLPALTLTWERLWMVGAHALETAPVIELRIVGTDGDLAELAHWPHLQGVVCLDLGRDSMGAGRVATLLDSPYLSELKELELGQNCVGDDGARVIAHAQSLRGLERLGLASNSLSCLGLRLLFDSAVLESLTELDLHNNHFDRNHSTEPPKNDSALLRLRVLKLGRSRLGSRGLSVLAATRSTSTIEVLELSHNRLGDDGIADLCGLSHLTRLRHLDVGRNSVSDRGAHSLATCAHLSCLQTLELDDNNVCAVGVSELLSQSTFTSLECLSLRSNPLGDIGALAIANAPLASHLRDIDLEGAAIGPSGLLALATSTGLQALRTLGLRDNSLGESAIALADPSRLPELASLDLQASRIPKTTAKALRARFKKDVLV